jgi:hypothetical protein
VDDIFWRILLFHSLDIVEQGFIRLYYLNYFLTSEWMFSQNVFYFIHWTLFSRFYKIPCYFNMFQHININKLCFYKFSLDFEIVLTLWYFWNRSDIVVFLKSFWHCGYFWNRSDIVVFFKSFWHCGYFLFFILSRLFLDVLLPFFNINCFVKIYQK